MRTTDWTVVGQVLGPDGIAVNESFSGTMTMADDQPTLVALMREHEPRLGILGEVVGLARQRNGALWACAVGGPEIERWATDEEPFYLSMRVRAIPRERSRRVLGKMVEVSLVRRPAASGLSPVVFSRGSVVRQRGGYPLSAGSTARSVLDAVHEARRREPRPGALRWLELAPLTPTSHARATVAPPSAPASKPNHDLSAPRYTRDGKRIHRRYNLGYIASVT